MAACAVCIILAALPATAVAAPGKGALDNTLLTGFSVKGSNGYEVQVLTIGPRLVLLGASKGQVSASYAVAGRVSGNRIRARFGNLGRISVRFTPLRRHRGKGLPSRCKGPIQLAAHGTFEGTIRFAGERGYTRVNAHRARGIAIGANLITCAGGASSSALSNLATLTTNLTAIAREPGRVLSLDAVALGDDRRLTVTGSLLERRGKMKILRTASTMVGGKRTFVSSEVGQHPAHARLSPPKPFSGVGVFQETSSASSSWSGSIAAWLPGAGKVGLAGPRFASNLCQRQPAADSGCELFPTVQRSFLRAQGSGSQSQARWEVMLSWSRYLRNSASSSGSIP